MTVKRSRKGPVGPRSLASVQVDVTTRLGAVAPTTTTGFPSLDALLGGGLRSGNHVLIWGAPGVGKTALALLLAYMAARARAGVLFTSVGLDETEVMARLAARSLHREYHNVAATYGTLWSGVAMQDPGLRGPITGCLASVVKKVGEHLHLHAAEPLTDVEEIAEIAATLWSRHDRVVVIVDGAEAFSAHTQGEGGGAIASMSREGRLPLVGYELSRLASRGAAVITTCHADCAPLLMPAATIAAELRSVREHGSRAETRRAGKVAGTAQSRPMDLAVTKNRLGPALTLPLTFHAAASIFEEREP